MTRQITLSSNMVKIKLDGLVKQTNDYRAELTVTVAEGNGQCGEALSFLRIIAPIYGWTVHPTDSSNIKWSATVSRDKVTGTSPDNVHTNAVALADELIAAVNRHSAILRIVRPLIESMVASEKGEEAIQIAKVALNKSVATENSLASHAEDLAGLRDGQESHERTINKTVTEMQTAMDIAKDVLERMVNVETDHKDMEAGIADIMSRIQRLSDRAERASLGMKSVVTETVSRAAFDALVDEVGELQLNARERAAKDTTTGLSSVKGRLTKLEKAVANMDADAPAPWQKRIRELEATVADLTQQVGSNGDIQ